MKKETKIIKLAEFVGKNEIVKRYKAKTPKFFKRLTKVGLICAGIGGAIATAPVSLPAGIVALGGYLVTVGGAIAVVAPLAKED